MAGERRESDRDPELPRYVWAEEREDRLMLGYDAHVHEIRPGVSDMDVRRIAELPWQERMSYLTTLTSRRAAHVPYRTWVD